MFSHSQDIKVKKYHEIPMLRKLWDFSEELSCDSWKISPTKSKSFREKGHEFSPHEWHSRSAPQQLHQA
jgi:hypothetical protein